IPQLNAYLKHGRETAAIESLQEIYRAQTQYHSAKGRFGNLDELVETDMLSRKYKEGKTISQYTYTTSDLTPNQFTVHADRESDGAGYKDFNIIEKGGDIYFIENKTKTSVPRG